MDFTGKTAISTGAASGMGLLFAECFTELGGNVVMCDVNEAVLNEKVKLINSKGKGKVCDVCDYDRLANDKNFPTVVQFDWSEV